MTEFTLYELFNEMLMLTLKLSAPLLLLGMVIGVLVSIFQTATSIQEQSLSFVPKIMITVMALIGLGPWILTQLMQFAIKLMGQLQNFAR